MYGSQNMLARFKMTQLKYGRTIKEPHVGRYHPDENRHDKNPPFREERKQKKHDTDQSDQNQETLGIPPNREPAGVRGNGAGKFRTRRQLVFVFRFEVFLMNPYTQLSRGDSVFGIFRKTSVKMREKNVGFAIERQRSDVLQTSVEIPESIGKGTSGNIDPMSYPERHENRHRNLPPTRSATRQNQADKWV